MRSKLRENLGDELVKLFETNRKLDGYRRMAGFDGQVVKSLDAITELFNEELIRHLTSLANNGYLTSPGQSRVETMIQRLSTTKHNKGQ